MTVKNKLLSLGLSAALVTMAGVGVAAAQTSTDDTTTDSTPIVTMARDRDRAHDGDRYDGEPLQVRDRLHDQTHDAIRDADQTRLVTHDGTCLLDDRPEDGTGMQYGRS